jgi:uncharacterized membrane protein YkvA (DUF1232 family)
MDLSAPLAIALGLIGAWALLVVVLWVFRPRDVRAGELVRVVPDVLRLVRNLLADRTVSIGVRIALVVLLAWLVSPVDLVPEFIPVLGPLDDVIVTVIVLRYARRQLGEDDLRRRWRGTPEGFGLLTGILGR